MKIIVIGAIAGGATVASQIRRVLPEAIITLIGMEERIGYGACGMPFVIGGIIEDPAKVAGPNPQRFQQSKNIRTLISCEVLSIDRQEKRIVVKNLKTNEQFIENYDKLIVATGSTPKMPNYEGIDTIPHFSLKTYDDMMDMTDYIEREKPSSCAIVGTGFIGIELAENFVARGIQPSMIVRGNRVMRTMDSQITALLHEEMLQHGVKFYFQQEIKKIHDRTITFQNGETIHVDFLAISIGTVPNTSLLEEANITIGETKGVLVNEYMQTEDACIYALGDIAECKDWFTGKPTRVQLAWHAHRQAFIIAQHLAGKKIKIQPFLGTTITKLFTLTAGMTGLSENKLIEEKIPYETVVHEGRTNAGYYPEHGTILIRVHYDPNSRKILGAQAVGNRGVDKRMDVIVTAIMGGLTIDDLSALELSYSPPYSSPKDPVNMVGYKAQK